MDKNTRQRYAVKIVYAKHDVSHEVDALRACQGHPNIVSLHEVVKDERYTYILMELLSGGELFERIRENRKFTEQDAVLFFRQIVHAVHHMHTKNIAHRDLKAENIIFTSRNSTELKLVDFGFAKQNSNSGMTTPCFTLDYAAPEVLVNNSVLNAGATPYSQPYTEASDLWSLGVILYTMLCGQTPFSPKRGQPSEATESNQQQPTPTETRVRLTMERIKQGAIETDINEWHSVSESAKSLVCALLTVDPRKRMTMSRLLRHEWLKNALPFHDLRHAPLPKGQQQAQSVNSKEADRAFEFCTRDELPESNKLVQRRHRRRSRDVKREDEDAGKGEEEEDGADDQLGRSNSSSGIVTSEGNHHSFSVDSNSSDVEIVAEYKERPLFKMQKSILADALAQQQGEKVAGEALEIPLVGTTRSVAEGGDKKTAARGHNGVKEEDAPMDVADSTTDEEARLETEVVVRLSTSDEETRDGQEQIVPADVPVGVVFEELPQVAQAAAAAATTEVQQTVESGSGIVITKDQSVARKPKQVLHYFEAEAAVGVVGRDRQFKPQDEAFFRGFVVDEVESAQERVRMWRLHATKSVADSVTRPLERGRRTTRKRKRSSLERAEKQQQPVEGAVDLSEFMLRTRADFETRVKVPRVTAAMNSGPVDRPKSKKINWDLFAERRDMPRRAASRRRPEVDCR